KVPGVFAWVIPPVVRRAGRVNAPVKREGKLVRRVYALTDARPRARADRPGAAPLQEVAGAEWYSERAAEAEVLREALRGTAARRVAQAECHPQGQVGGTEALRRAPDDTGPPFS